METWFIILITICISVILRSIFELLIPTKSLTHKLPPGPPTIPILGNFLWLKRSGQEIESILRDLTAKLGPMVTLRLGSQAAIFVSDRSLTHKALIHNGAIFAGRPEALPITKIESSNQHTINTASYGPTWRVLRRNLTEKTLNPSRVKSYSHARKWVLDILLNSLKSSDHLAAILVMEHFQYAMYSLLVLMCFGDKLEEKQIMEILSTQRHLLLNVNRFNILNFFPMVTKIVFRKRWQEFYEMLQVQKDVLVPLIRERKKVKEGRLSKVKENRDEEEKHEQVLCYVDTLLDLQLPEERRNLDEEEMVSLCAEFLDAGTDTTSTALQWIMANLVKYPEIQERLLTEMKGVMLMMKEEDALIIEEDDLQKMPYLRAVVLEGLRRHPPAHFVLPHAVTEEDTILDEFLVPKKNGTINFMVAEMGLDPKVWKDPMDFKPERFLKVDDHDQVFDITGSREIRMMPFGAGRRICPALALALLHLEYFVANLIWSFHWKAVDGEGVDLDEKQEFLTVMKNPLKVHLSPRF
ncbi:hypothetical protein LWI28_025877 [Acer negundo]|uniref:Cytochrome P450 n=1 Tax=Acer negundo TaxID=4023 RepID=A0AAD5IBQ4_ACENE|nr:hypothetical protein LWI28_025877 [Acer negundo]KAK4836497.1 hypothetical protein QYF36_023897 [Acer negundo]